MQRISFPFEMEENACIHCFCCIHAIWHEFICLKPVLRKKSATSDKLGTILSKHLSWCEHLHTDFTCRYVPFSTPSMIGWWRERPQVVVRRGLWEERHHANEKGAFKEREDSESVRQDTGSFLGDRLEFYAESQILT